MVEGISERVRSAREGAGLSQEGLARMVGVSSMTISRIERGLVGGSPSLDVATGIASALGVSLDWLVHGKGPRKARA